MTNIKTVGKVFKLFMLDWSEDTAYPGTDFTVNGKRLKINLSPTRIKELLDGYDDIIPTFGIPEYQNMIKDDDEIIITKGIPENNFNRFLKRIGFKRDGSYDYDVRPIEKFETTGKLFRDFLKTYIEKIFSYGIKFYVNNIEKINMGMGYFDCNVFTDEDKIVVTYGIPKKLFDDFMISKEYEKKHGKTAAIFEQLKKCK